jgi:hypothetical protein
MISVLDSTHAGDVEIACDGFQLSGPDASPVFGGNLPLFG